MSNGDIIKVEAESLEEARLIASSKIGIRQRLGEEQILREGAPVIIERDGEIAENILSELEKRIPTGAKIIGKELLRSSVEYNLKIEAFNEQTARHNIECNLKPYERIKSLQQIAAGSSGFLGFGKKPNQYGAIIYQNACGRMTYKEKTIVQYKIFSKTLIDAAKEGLISVESVLADGAPLEEVDAGGYTAFMWAASMHKKDIMKFLISKGANVNAGTKWGATALTRAAQDGDKDIVELLLDNGADVNAKEYDGYTALMRAIQSGHHDIINLLIAHGADASDEDNTENLSKCSGENVKDIINITHGGFGEPYCSQECYDRGGKYAFAVMARNQTGICGFCQRPVQASMYGARNCAIIPYEGVNLFICNRCTREGQEYLKNYRKCCMCQKDLSMC